MNLNKEQQFFIQEKLSAHFNEQITIHSVSNVSGGCINACYTIKTGRGTFFLKVNDEKKFPGMFAAEARGLELLQSVCAGFVPSVIKHAAHEGDQFLVLEFIQSTHPTVHTWKEFARHLSQLHKNTSGAFGLDQNNYMGSLTQNNSFQNTFLEFFILQRIAPLLKKAIDKKLLPQDIDKNFQRLYRKLHEIIPAEPPALIHGDLWSGNFMCDEKGVTKIIDPAIAYSHRECDLSMTRLFGGFDSSFYKYYNDFFLLENGFEKRVDIYNLYPLLVHVILFGGSYPTQVADIMKRF
ncbi:MAG: fructosamine kinase family protein [Chitinophagales bacterium]|nr:fructosamine kinase family protein [Chitinophagales bacterium]